MKKIFLLVLMLMGQKMLAQDSLSKRAQISLITLGPGTELYSIFGHTAIRVEDPEKHFDQIYNFGAFDFRTPFFYLKYMRGTLDYQAIAYPYQNEAPSWLAENRQATIQVLNMTQSQKQRIFQALETSLLPENKYYKYKFIDNNCTTKDRDLIFQILGEKLHLDQNLNAGLTTRQWIDSCAHKSLPWADFGMDLVLGEVVDRPIDHKKAMFLPMNLLNALHQARVQTESGSKAKAVSEQFDVAIALHSDTVNSLKPETLFWFMFGMILGLTILQFARNNHSFMFDKLLFSMAGLVGWLLFFMWFGTVHAETKNNFNLIWAFPLLFPFGLFLKHHLSKQWYSKYYLAYAVILCLLLLFQPFLPQKLEAGMVPIVLCLATRATFVWYRLRKLVKPSI